MPFCPFVFAAVADELRAAALGAKVDKINQPEKDRLVLTLRGGDNNRRKNLKLLLCARPGAARIHLTEQTFDNPMEPPMFCMLLRKYLTGARIAAVEQPDYERVLTIRFSASDELGYDRTVSLVFEAAGRVPNIVLIDGENRILDCLKRANVDANAVRPLLPGLYYQLPPTQDGKQNPGALTDAERLQLFAAGRDPFDALQEHLSGLCPLVCRIITANAGGDTAEDLAKALSDITSQYADRRFTPTLIRDPAKHGTDFTVVSVPDTMVVERFDTPSEMLDKVYAEREEAEKQATRAGAILRPVKAARQKLAKKLGLQREELQRTFQREEYRMKGDILNANLYRIPRGAASVRLPNFYEENEPEVEIALDVRLSPQKNAQKYYAEYAKLKSAKNHLETIIEQGQRELDYLDSTIYAISAADRNALVQIEAELTEQGYLRSANSKKNKKAKLPPLPPLEFTVDGGYTVLVGRTGKQNDELTFHTAGKNDLWFHVKGVPGSHVILFSGGEEPSAVAYTQAAELAASHSSLKGTGKVSVDYTQVRYVKKLPGAMPGMVTYDRYSTAVVDS